MTSYYLCLDTSFPQPLGRLDPTDLLISPRNHPSRLCNRPALIPSTHPCTQDTHSTNAPGVLRSSYGSVVAYDVFMESSLTQRYCKTSRFTSTRNLLLNIKSIRTSASLEGTQSTLSGDILVELKGLSNRPRWRVPISPFTTRGPVFRRLSSSVLVLLHYNETALA